MNDGLASTKCGSWYPFARAKVSMRSPPTASASEAKSCSVVTTFSLANAGVPGDTSRTRVRATRASFVGFIENTSERMGAVGTYRELELKKQLVKGLPIGVLAAPKFPPELGKLARPEGEKKGP